MGWTSGFRATDVRTETGQSLGETTSKEPHLWPYLVASHAHLNESHEETCVMLYANNRGADCYI